MSQNTIRELLNEMAAQRGGLSKTASVSKTANNVGFDSLPKDPESAPVATGQQFNANTQDSEAQNPLSPDGTPANVNSVSDKGGYPGPVLMEADENPLPFSTDPAGSKTASLTDTQFVAMASDVLAQLAKTVKKAEEEAKAHEDEVKGGEKANKEEEAEKAKKEESEKQAAAVKKAEEESKAHKDEVAGGEKANKEEVAEKANKDKKDEEEKQAAAINDFVAREAAGIWDMANRDSSKLAEYLNVYHTKVAEEKPEMGPGSGTVDERHTRLVSDATHTGGEIKPENNGTSPAGSVIPKPLTGKRGPGRPRKEDSVKAAGLLSRLLTKVADDIAAGGPPDAADASGAVAPGVAPDAGAPGEIPPDLQEAIESLLQAGLTPEEIEQVLSAGLAAGPQGAAGAPGAPGAGAPPAGAAPMAPPVAA